MGIKRKQQKGGLIMAFIQPCFIRKNTPELRKKLEELGYKICVCCSFDDNIWLNTFLYEDREEVHGIGCWDDSFPCKKEDVFKDYINENNERKNPNIDCGTNEELFLALASLRNNSDMNSWFKDLDTNKLFICTKNSIYDVATEEDIDKYGDWIGIGMNKYQPATVKEIIEHFKDK